MRNQSDRPIHFILPGQVSGIEITGVRVINLKTGKDLLNDTRGADSKDWEGDNGKANLRRSINRGHACESR